VVKRKRRENETKKRRNDKRENIKEKKRKEKRITMFGN